MAEFTYECRVSGSGSAFRVANVFVLRVRDGRIVASRDYADHLAFAGATGRLSEVVSALGDPAAG